MFKLYGGILTCTTRVLFVLFLISFFKASTSNAIENCTVSLNHRQTLIREVEKEFNSFIENWREEKVDSFSSDKRGLNITKTFVDFEGERYRYVAYLGSGGEGRVFLIESPSGQRRIIKHFYEGREDRDENLYYLKSYKSRGAPMLEVYGTVDSDKFIAEYVPGHSISRVANSNKLSQKAKDLILAEYARISQNNEEWFGEVNTFVYFEHGQIKFKIIDPF